MLLSNWELENTAIQYLNYVFLDYSSKKNIVIALLNT